MATDKSNIINHDQWEDTVLNQESDTLYVLVFSADWCGLCKTVSRMLDKVILELLDDVVVIRIDTGNRPEIASKFFVSVLPTLLFIKKGIVRRQATGLISPLQLKDIIESIV